MGKFLRSAWSDLVGILSIAIGTLPVADVVELTKSGEIISVILAAVGGILIGGGRGAEPKEADTGKRR